MVIKAIKYFERGFYAQGMAFGGEEGAEKRPELMIIAYHSVSHCLFIR